MENKKTDLILEGLCCPNCGAKIENEVNNLPEVAEASLNMVNNKLSISFKEDASTDIYNKVCNIVASHEPSVKVKNTGASEKEAEGHENSEGGDEKESNMKLYIFRLGFSILLSAVFTFINAPEGVRITAFVIALLLSGYDIFLVAGKNILKGKVFDENFLMAIAAIGAFLIGKQVEAVSVLVFYGIGEMLQDMAVHRSRRNIAGLMDIRPDYANVKRGEDILVVSPDQVEVGEIILVKPGEKIPLDGIVTNGSSFIDARALTGESVPVEVKEEDTVFSGAVNTSGVIEVTITKPYGESTVSKILELVQNSGSKKAESEKFITKFARYYTPIVVFTAAAVAVFPPIFGFGNFSDWIYRALSFLIISCPCALVISIPISFFGGIGGGAKQGVLIKGGNYLDALNKVATIVFDKTGTLTKGVFEVTKVSPAEGVDVFELIRLAAIAESNSNHPIAKSILSYYNQLNSNEALDTPSQITELAGHGVIASLNGESIYAGNSKLMNKYGITAEEPTAGGSIVHIALNDKYMGYTLISDDIKPGVKETMLELKNYGVKKTVMLTGDQKDRAEEIAKLCGIDEFHAELLPQDKVNWFEQYKEQTEGNGKVVFVGDGINDAPVLAGADIGIAMGGIGSDAAIEAADVVIMNDDIGKIAMAIKIARKTRRIVNQNIVFALGFKLLIMVLSFLGITSIWFAIFADVGVALIALLNAMRAMYVK